MYTSHFALKCTQHVHFATCTTLLNVHVMQPDVKSRVRGDGCRTGCRWAYCTFDGGVDGPTVPLKDAETGKRYTVHSARASRQRISLCRGTCTPLRISARDCTDRCQCHAKVENSIVGGIRVFV